MLQTLSCVRQGNNNVNLCFFSKFHYCIHHYTTTITRHTKSKCRQNINYYPYSTDTVHGTIPDGGKGVMVGQYLQKERIFTNEEVQQYGSLIHDWNPLHVAQNDNNNWNDTLHKYPDLQATVETGFIEFEPNKDNNNAIVPKVIVHGMLVASMFSSMFATIAPGCIYINQSIDFRLPVFVNQSVLAKIEIDRIREWKRQGVVVECLTTIMKATDKITTNEKESKQASTIVLKGVANVWLPSGHEGT